MLSGSSKDGKSACRKYLPIPVALPPTIPLVMPFSGVVFRSPVPIQESAGEGALPCYFTTVEPVNPHPGGLVHVTLQLGRPGSLDPSLYLWPSKPPKSPWSVR